MTNQPVRLRYLKPLYRPRQPGLGRRQAKYREIFAPSGAKDDPTDAEFALEFLLKYPERLNPLDPPSAEMRALEWFADKASLLFCDFLARWPSVKAARQARRATLERFFHDHNIRRPALIQQRIDAIKQAIPLTDPKRLTSDLIACRRSGSQAPNLAVVRYSSD